MPNGWNLEPGEKDPTMKIIAGVVAVGAIALGVVFATRGGDDKGSGGTSKPPATTVVTGVTTTTTTAGTTTTTTGVTTTTTSGATTTMPSGPIDGATLVAAMPAAAETPTGWERAREPLASPTQDESEGFCDQATEVGRAAEHGVAAIAHGPGYTLPSQAHFSFTIYTFGSSPDAAAFMQQLRDDANLCSSSPISYTSAEADLDFASDAFGDFEWNVREASAASQGQFVGEEGIVRVTVEMRYAATQLGENLSAQETVLIVYEQHGRSVIEYWIDGVHDLAGISVVPGQPDWAFHPTQADLDSAVTTIQEPMLTRLEAAGAF